MTRHWSMLAGTQLRQLRKVLAEHPGAVPLKLGAPAEGCLHLVVAAPDGQRGVAAQAARLPLHLPAHLRQEVRIPWVPASVAQSTSVEALHETHMHGQQRDHLPCMSSTCTCCPLRIAPTAGERTYCQARLLITSTLMSAVSHHISAPVQAVWKEWMAHIAQANMASCQMRMPASSAAS